jgi:hypothetical protein
MPISTKMLQEMRFLNDMSGHVEEARECSHVVTIHVLARAPANPFDEMPSAFALPPMGGTGIRGRECQFQTLGAIYALQAPDYLRSITQEVSHTVEPDIEFEPSEIID